MSDRVEAAIKAAEASVLDAEARFRQPWIEWNLSWPGDDTHITTTIALGHLRELLNAAKDAPLLREKLMKAEEGWSFDVARTSTEYCSLAERLRVAEERVRVTSTLLRDSLRNVGREWAREVAAEMRKK